DGRAALALWSADDQPREAEVALPDLTGTTAEVLAVADGTRTQRPVTAGRLRLSVGAAPQLVLYPVRQPETAASRPVHVLPPARPPRPVFLAAPKLAPAFPGQPFRVPFSVVNGGDRPVTVTPRLAALPAGWTLAAAPASLTCAANAEADGAFQLALAPGAAPGPVTLQLQAEECDNLPVDAEVALPFTLEVAPLLVPLRKGEFTLNARITNGGAAPLRGAVAVSVPDARVTPAGAVAVNLAPGRSSDLACTVKLETVPEVLRARFSGSLNGLPFTLDRAVSYAGIFQSTRPVIVDGVLDDWPRSPAFQLGEPGQVRPDASWWHGPADLSGRLWFQWDAAALYIAAEVTDNVHFQPATGGATWMGDGFQFTLGGTQVPLYEILIAKTARGAEVYQLVAPDGRVGPVPGARAAIVERNGRLVYEVAIPWVALPPLRGEAGTRMPMNFILNDNDGAGRLGYLECRPGIGSGKFMHRSLHWLLAPAGG
ncbi:MAG: sugar-binding protein, partial [Lentisphaeria bacterium]